MKSNFRETKEEVLRLYNELVEAVSKSGYSDEDTTLQGLKVQSERIKEDKFCLLIAGEAKSGKSTFINAYLGTEILPMDVRQCTSAIVEIAHGEEFYLQALYADDRLETVKGVEAVNKFLKENAALDDDYRDIPVPTINNEIIIKYKDKKIHEYEILDLLEAVKSENIHRLPQEEYNKKIRNYIKEKQESWQSVVKKIDIIYPFEDENMRGIRIIDSPGVNAAGKVGDASAEYIESADAIMFLRPITGVAIEANSFKEFLESKSVDRNKNAMFLVLTRTASESQDTINRAYEEFINMFGTMKSDAKHGIVKEQIIPVDSKAELYFNKFKNMETPEIGDYIKELRNKEKAEAFLALAWADACWNKENLLEELKRISNFKVIDQSLNTFGRKAQYIALSEFLGRILKISRKINVYLKEKIENYSLKVEDPHKLAVKISEIQSELTIIENRLNQKADEILNKYSASEDKGIIQCEAEKVISDFREEIKKLDADSERSIEELEKISFRKVGCFIEFQNSLQKKVVDDCNIVLQVALSENNNIDFVSLEPDFTEDVVNRIKEEVKKESYESYEYTTGRTFVKSHKKSRFSQKNYYDRFSKNILERLDSIKKQAVRDLRLFVDKTITAYTKELRKNADFKREELQKVEKDKQTAEELQVQIGKLKKEISFIEALNQEVAELKGGIDKIV